MHFTWAFVPTLLGLTLAAPAPELEAYSQLAKRPECTAGCILACAGLGPPSAACYGPCFAACIATAQDGGEVDYPISVVNGTLVAPNGTTIFEKDDAKKENS
ncbi:uncharacterized protein MCYG_01558 [Microsporum canis CBS 113480]|uniref:Uncharacterized protein n=1 Tax=Arthroderma otae (strain ATCC MYA-4605 / CBS 113480) TaxID=554155 RepID=C5FHJ9_ARTOC|nr:uncharacterized protein MCYG_01558 [Microsporum canis CBS 113480]EEQ28739.1 predicted protein [Microsporum canis CBS 113480]